MQWFVKSPKNTPTENIMSNRSTVAACIAQNYPITSLEISEKTGLPFKNVRNTISNLMTNGVITSEGHPLNRLYSPARPKSSAVVNRSAPVCPSSMPNGDLPYWREHVRKMNTPARIGA
jgi:hypothetical protein